MKVVENISGARFISDAVIFLHLFPQKVPLLAFQSVHLRICILNFVAVTLVMGKDFEIWKMNECFDMALPILRVLTQYPTVGKCVCLWMVRLIAWIIL